MPNYVARAYSLDENNGNTLWSDAIAKEMKDVSTAYRILDNGDIVPIVYHQLGFQMIFDVKMEDLCLKARLIAGGHVIEPPATITYATVVSRKTVRIALTLDALNDLPVKVVYIQNDLHHGTCHREDMDSPGPRVW